jgi:uncharacterized protein YndB with AHSA1/START domain
VGTVTAPDACRPVSVSRRIEAPAAVIFKVLADPARHPAFDGSGMLRPGATNGIVQGVGDIFVMKMYVSQMGDYETHNRIVAYEADRCIAWEPQGAGLPKNGSRWRFDLAPDGPQATVVTETYDCSECPEDVRQVLDDGKVWIAGMTESLERLNQLCATHP